MDKSAYALMGRGMADENLSNVELVELTTDIVSAYVSNNPVSVADLPSLMNAVHDQFKSLAEGSAESVRPDPAVPIKKSVGKDYIICLEDGAKLKMLKQIGRAHV